MLKTWRDPRLHQFLSYFEQEHIYFPPLSSPAISTIPSPLLLFATLPPEWREFHTIRSSSNLKWTEVFCQPVAGSWRKSLTAAIKPEKELGLRVKWPRGEWGEAWKIEWYEGSRISNIWPTNTGVFFIFLALLTQFLCFSQETGAKIWFTVLHWIGKPKQCCKRVCVDHR